VTDLSESPDREALRHHYESSGDAPTECWANYGDVNPAPHGGMWLHYEGDGWMMIGTFVAEDVGLDPDVDDPIKAQYVYQSPVAWRDIVTEDGGWTDRARGTVESLHHCPETPAAAVVDERLSWLVAGFADEKREAYSRRDPIKTGDYRSILESVGVDPCPDDL
jgi:hypothetical protein